jgi:hypothetical protein
VEIKNNKKKQVYIQMTKYEKLLQNSNPDKVSKNALDYFGKAVPIYMSDKPSKKYMLRKPNGQYVHFGDINYQDFTRTLDKDKQKRYLARAMKIKGDWFNDPYSPNNLSLNLTWV